jgi:ABC-type nitrate/sulfonate/bicarbonate transport system substrate-binding protein
MSRNTRAPARRRCRFWRAATSTSPGGDLDITPLAVGPALFNQVTQGFNIRVVASVGLETKGRVTSGWLTLLKDEAPQVKQPSDLKGKTLEAGVEGSPLDLLVRNAVTAGGLTSGQDVTISYKARTPGDWLAIAQARGADAISMQEPTATQLERQALVTRWLTFADLAPWFQAANLAVSDNFLNNQAEVVQKFLEVYVTTCRHINAANGAWTDELMNLATKWTGVTPAHISGQGGVMYYDPNGLPSADALRQVQTFWQQAGQVQQPVDMNQLVATAPLEAALAKVGRLS